MKKRIGRSLVVFVISLISMILFMATVSASDVYYDSVADMKAALLSSGTVVHTSGFYAPDDGGGATYSVVASGTADNYFSFQTASGTIAQLQVSDDTVNIRQIGAKGDGTADDTAAINAATQSTYGTVYAPSGTYIVTPHQHPRVSKQRAAIILGTSTQDGKNLIGAGRDLTIFKIADDAVLDGNRNVKRYGAVITGYTSFISDVTLKDFTIDQNVQNNPAMPLEGAGTDADGVSYNYQKMYCIKSTLERVNIENIRFKHQGSNAIYVADTLERGTGYKIHDCYFEFDMNSEATTTNYDNSCLYCVGDGFKIYNNVITTALNFNTEIQDMRNPNAPFTSQIYGVGGIEIHGEDAEVYNNQINKYYIGMHYQAREGYTVGSKVHDNDITNAHIGISFGRDNEVDTLSGARVYDNNIEISLAYKKGFRNSALQPCGIRCFNSSLGLEDVQIENNVIEYKLSTLITGYDYNFGEHAGIILRGASMEDILVYQNTIKNAPGWGIEVNRYISGITVNNYTVQENEFLDCGWSDDFNVSGTAILDRRAAIRLNKEREQSSISNIRIISNTIKDTSADGQCIYAIYAPTVLVNAGKAVISNNTEISTSEKGFYVPYFSSITGQNYEQKPITAICNEFPTTGTFYKNQEIRVMDGDDLESVWVITKSGVNGKQIPSGSKTGTAGSYYIVMDNANHGIQSGDIINVTTENNVILSDVWVNAVTGKTLYIRDLNLTGDVTVTSYSQAAWEAKHTNKDIETVFSAVPEDTTVIKNILFNVMITTHMDVNRIKIENENGQKLTILESSSTVSGDNRIWNIKIKIGTAGTNRTFIVYGAIAALEYSTLYKEFTVDVVESTLPLDFETVISAVPEVAAVVKNQDFNVTVTTVKDVNQIEIFSENGTKIGIRESSYTISGDKKIWNITLRVGSAGERVFKVYGIVPGYAYPQTYKEFSIIVV